MFLDTYTQLRDSDASHTGEPPLQYSSEHASIQEEIVRCLWFGSHFNQDELKTDDGKRIEILSPGWWNVEGGPDFIRAEFLIEDAGHVTGDVEVHTLSKAWYEHGHHHQPEYNSVVLHVTMWDNNGNNIVKQNQQLVPQLTLSRYIDEEVAELTEIVDMEHSDSTARQDNNKMHNPNPERFCKQAIRDGKISVEWLAQFLDAAGDHRLQQKAEGFGNHAGSATFDDLLYRNIAEALGYKNNRLPFLQLTKLLPLSKLRELIPRDASFGDRCRTLEALFFGMAGTLDTFHEAQADDLTRQYAADLKFIWFSQSKEFRELKMSASHWDMAGTRPVNHPLRRIAALASLLANDNNLHDGLFGKLRLAMETVPKGRKRVDVAAREALIKCITDLHNGYWSHRFNFHSAPVSQSLALIGTQRAKTILTNVILPLLLTYSRENNDHYLEKKIFTVWSNLPSGPDNHVLKRMQQVLFPININFKTVAGSFRRQQGLQQLYNDCCMNNSGCQDCVLYKAYSKKE